MRHKIGISKITIKSEKQMFVKCYYDIEQNIFQHLSKIKMSSGEYVFMTV